MTRPHKLYQPIIINLVLLISLGNSNIVYLYAYVVIVITSCDVSVKFQNSTAISL